VQTFSGMDEMRRTALQVAEAQQDAYAAVADNVASFQRRNLEFAKGGLEFLRLQEDNARAARRWWASGVELLRLQQRNAGFAQNWLTNGAEFLRDQAEANVRVTEAVTRSARTQQESFWGLAEEWAGTYESFFSPFAYARQGLQVAQEATEQGLRLAEETAEQTEETIRKTEDAARWVELEATVRGALRTGDYEELTVAEVSKRLDGLSRDELEQVREYEKRTKDRETLVEQIDRKLKALS
jgi:hypothetical protein